MPYEMFMNRITTVFALTCYQYYFQPYDKGPRVRLTANNFQEVSVQLLCGAVGVQVPAVSWWLNRKLKPLPITCSATTLTAANLRRHNTDDTVLPPLAPRFSITKPLRPSAPRRRTSVRSRRCVICGCDRRVMNNVLQRAPHGGSG
jgi:hypothetical protein